MARNTVRGPGSYPSHADKCDIHVARSISIHPSLPSISQWQSYRVPNVTRLLPGGRFVLFLDQGRLYCWNVTSDRLVWQYHCNDHSLYTVREFAAEVIDGGRVTVIAIAVHIPFKYVPTSITSPSRVQCLTSRDHYVATNLRILYTWTS